MADFIDRDKTEQDIINRDSRISAAVADIDSYLTGKAQMQMEILDIIREQPTVDTEQHAHWIVVGGDLGYVSCKCSACGYTDCFDDESELYNYCPECGKKMNEVEDETQNNRV